MGLVEKKRGRKVKCWWECLKEDRKAFGILDEGWLQAAPGVEGYSGTRCTGSWPVDATRNAERRRNGTPD